MPKFEPFDIIALFLTVCAVGMLCVGAVLNHVELFENARYIIISITSAYIGKRWKADEVHVITKEKD